MNENFRNTSIYIELNRAILYLRIGLSEIQKINRHNRFYDPIFIFLSSGIERLLKIMLCLNFLEINNKLPKTNEIWNNKNGHDILFLKSKVEDICIKINIATNDYDIIINDEIINQICKILSDFGKNTKYFHINVILGKEQGYDAKEEWGKLENKIIEKIYNKKIHKLEFDEKSLIKIYHDVNKEIIIKLEIFFRALTRQFMFGNFSKLSQTYINEIYDFFKIEDNQLGLTDYEKYKNHEFIKR